MRRLPCTLPSFRLGRPGRLGRPVGRLRPGLIVGEGWRPVLGRWLLGSCLLLAPWLCSQALWAQQPQPEAPAVDTFQVDTTQSPMQAVRDTFFLDSLALPLQLSQPPVSPLGCRVWVNGRQLPAEGVRLQAPAGRLWLEADTTRYLSVVVAYKRFTRPLPDTLALPPPPGLVVDSLLSWQEQYSRELEQIQAQQRQERIKQSNTLNLTDLGDLRRSGSLSRAVTVGSGRDLAVNSDFRLNMEGQLADDLRIQAAITDRNLPLQPSGYTQQLQDFDRVYIELQKDSARLAFGDLEIEETESRFANFYRNILGVRLRGAHPRYPYRLFGGVAKGTFATNSFMGQNGNQGPYRLQGQNGEAFIVVLAGSEKVYINGRRVQRGVDRDYVIEYNTGEITFTTNQPITNVTRIVVDFEYVERSYSRSLVGGEGTARLFGDRLKLTAGYTREADNPDNPVDRVLTDGDRQALQQAGDRPEEALTNGVDTVEWDPERILYRAVDTLVDDSVYSPVFVFSRDSTQARYALSFSYVGSGQGNYVRQPANANGIVYRWVAPTNGQPNGDYAPRRQLSLPRLLQVFRLDAAYALSDKLTLFSEQSVSDYDRNRLSDLDDQDNLDLALESGLRWEGVELGERVRWRGEAFFRYVGRRYQNLDRVFRYEYGREWNFNDLGARAVERVAETRQELRIAEHYQLSLELGYRSMGDSLESWKQTLRFSSQDSSLLEGQHFYTAVLTVDDARQSRSWWFRHEGDLSHRFGSWRLGLESWGELRRERLADTLTNGTFGFLDLTPYTRLEGRDKISVEVRLNGRYDQEFFQNANRPKSWAVTPNLETNWRPGRGVQLRFTGNYRYFLLLDSLFTEQNLSREEQLLTANLQLNYSRPKGGLSLSGRYILQNERQSRRDVVYLEVSPGLGRYEWVDANGDGLQNFDEFQLSTNALTANFVRLLVPNNEQFNAVAVRLGGNLNVDFRQLVAPGSGWAWLRNINTRLVFRGEQRKRATASAERYLFQFTPLTLADTSLLNATYYLRQDVFLFQNREKGQLQLAYQHNQGLAFLSTGNELRIQRRVEIQPEYRLDPSKSLQMRVQLWRSAVEAELLPDRAYNVRALEAAPKANWRLNKRIRLSGGYRFQLKENAPPEQPQADVVVGHRVYAELRWTFGARNNLQAKVEALRLSLTGEPNPTARFELLESLAEGNNLLLNAQWTQYLSDALELSLIYDGRLAAGRPALHTAQMQIKALF